MANIDINAAAGELGLRQAGKSYVGVVDGWPLRLDGNKSSVWATLKTARNARSKDLKEFKPYTKQNKILVTWNQQDVRIVVNAKSAEQISAAEHIRACLGILTSVGASTPDRCPVCKKGGCDTAALNGQAYVPYHLECLKQYAQKSRAKVEEGAFSGSYLLGTLGAILGMIVGTLPQLILIIAMQRVWALLMALIPICAYFGYKLFRGKLNGYAIFISILMAVVGVATLGWEQVVYELMHSYDYPLKPALEATWELMHDWEVWKELLSESVMEFVMAALGVFISFGIITRTDKGDAAGAQAALETAMPLDGADTYAQDESYRY